MGLKNTLKQIIMYNVMTKRKKREIFDEKASETYELPPDAKTDINNSYYFSAHDANGNSMFFRLGKRGGGQTEACGKDARAEVWFAFKPAAGTAYVNTECLFKINESSAIVKCVEPLKRWEFSFAGKVTPVAPDENLIARKNGDAIDAVFNGIFTSETGLYEFSRDTDTRIFCRGIAAEKWVKGFSRELNNGHQIHVEQEGHIEGTFKTGDREYKINSAGVRDHSFGRRVWSYMNQHKWFMVLMGDGSVHAANSVKYPALNTVGMKTGYKIRNNKTVNIIDWEYFGETNGTIPKSAKYKVKYVDKKTIDCSYNLEIAFPFEFTDNQGKYIIYEGISTYTINGEKGRGITEFGYNGDSARYKP